MEKGIVDVRRHDVKDNVVKRWKDGKKALESTGSALTMYTMDMMSNDITQTYVMLFTPFSR